MEGSLVMDEKVPPDLSVLSMEAIRERYRSIKQTKDQEGFEEVGTGGNIGGE